VAQACDGDEAIHLACHLRPDVILMDLKMPKVDGWQAIRRLKSDPITKDIIVIAVTAIPFPAERARAAAAGCDGYVRKPYDAASLADDVARVAAEGVSALSAAAVVCRMTFAD
jgi:CheY-like chemotaxis protein